MPQHTLSFARDLGKFNRIFSDFGEIAWANEPRIFATREELFQCTNHDSSKNENAKKALQEFCRAFAYRAFVILLWLRLLDHVNRERPKNKGRKRLERI